MRSIRTEARGQLAAVAGVAAVLLLAACGPGGGSAQPAGSGVVTPGPGAIRVGACTKHLHGAHSAAISRRQSDAFCSDLCI